MTTDITARRAELIEQQAAIGDELANVELYLAADLIRSVFSVTAVTLLVDKDSNDGISTDITLLVVLDSDQRPLWFNSDGSRHDSTDYPGAYEVSDGHGRPVRTMDWSMQTKLIEHLTAAYDAAGGATGAWSPVADGDEFYPLDFNVLSLDIPAALASEIPSRLR